LQGDEEPQAALAIDRRQSSLNVIALGMNTMIDAANAHVTG
jgi:hypothetical protein